MKWRDASVIAPCGSTSENVVSIFVSNTLHNCIILPCYFRVMKQFAETLSDSMVISEFKRIPYHHLNTGWMLPNLQVCVQMT